MLNIKCKVLTTRELHIVLWCALLFHLWSMVH